MKDDTYDDSFYLFFSFVFVFVFQLNIHCGVFWNAWRLHCRGAMCWRTFITFKLNGQWLVQALLTNDKCTIFFLINSIMKLDEFRKFISSFVCCTQWNTKLPMFALTVTFIIIKLYIKFNIWVSQKMILTTHASKNYTKLFTKSIIISSHEYGWPWFSSKQTFINFSYILFFFLSFAIR